MREYEQLTQLVLGLDRGSIQPGFNRATDLRPLSQASGQIFRHHASVTLIGGFVFSAYSTLMEGHSLEH